MRGPQEVRPAPNNAMRGPEQRPAPNNAMRGPERRSAPNTAMRPNPAPENRPANAMRGPQGRPGPNNAMRGPSRDFSSVRNYHQNFRAERRFRAGAYARPRGFYEHRWAWGETLPPLFWAQQYWILDFADYDLPPPPYGAVWVRVNDDAVLIDQYSGMIIEVDYGVFY
jgi:Ni/Co efflux regulator RcnB